MPALQTIVFVLLFSARLLPASGEVAPVALTSNTNIRILVVFDSRYPIYGAYGQLVLDFIQDRQLLHAPLPRAGNFSVTHVSVQVPRSDADGAFENLCRAFLNFSEKGGRPDLILDLTVTPLASATVKSFTKYADIPSASLLCCTKAERIQNVFDVNDSPNHLVFDPPSKVWINSVREFVEKEGMTTAAVVMDTSFELEKVHRVLLTNLPCKHLMVRLNFDDVMAVRNFTAKMKQIGMQNFFILSGVVNAGRLLEEAYTLDMLAIGKRPNFFLLTKDAGHVECPQCSEGGLVKLKPMYANIPLRDEVLAYVRKNSVPGSAVMQQDDYNEIDLVYTFDATRAVVSALVASDPIPRMTVENVVSCDTVYKEESLTKQTPKPTGSRLPQGTRSTRNLAWIFRAGSMEGILGSIIPGSGENNTVVDVKLEVEEQTINYDRTNITKSIGTWSYASGLTDHEGRFPRSITDKRLRVAILLETPFIMRTENSSAAPYAGYLIDLIQKISDELGFEYELYEVPDQQFGAVDENGEWNGLIRELIDKKADIGLAPLSVMAERENVVDFTVPYFDLVGVTILMKKANQEQSLFKFVTVLEAPVWGSIFGAYLLTSLLMFVFDRLSPYSYRNIEAKEARKKQIVQGGKGDIPVVVVTQEKVVEKKEEIQLDQNMEYGTRVFTLKESLWFCMTSLTPQGGGEAPRNLSGRLVAATWWMFGFIIIASYTANLAAFLTVSRLETQVASLDDLTKQYGIRYAPVENSATETYFKRMWKIEEKFYEIWRDMSLNESMSNKERAELAVWDYPVSDKYTKLWLTMKDFARPKTTDEGVEWVKNTMTTASGEKEGFALIGDSAILQYKANLDCDLTLIGEEFSRKPYALAVQEGSALRDQLSGVILKLLNQRELEMMKEEWWQMKNQKACTNSGDENEGISIQNIGGVFILVLAGTVLASVMLAFEYYWYRNRNRNRNQNQNVTKKPSEAKQVIEMTTTTTNRHGDNYTSNYNTDYNTRFHNVFSESKTDELTNIKEKPVNERRESNLAKDNHAYEHDYNNAETRRASHKEE